MEAKVKTDKDSNAIRRVRPRIRVLIVDDHSVLRQALRLLLQSHDDLDVLGEVANGREAVAAAEKLQPDVVLMDVVMPGPQRPGRDAADPQTLPADSAS